VDINSKTFEKPTDDLKEFGIIGADNTFSKKLSNDDIQISITANGNPKKAVEVKNKIKEFLEKIF